MKNLKLFIITAGCFLILFMLSGLAATNGSDNVCPSIEEVKTANFKNWLALDINDDEPATQEQIAKFIKSARAFNGAQWSSSYLYGFGRCNYTSKTEVYLASNQLPLLTRPAKQPWQWNGVVANCQGSIIECAFS